jgi:sulfite exporter TauE/SafE
MLSGLILTAFLMGLGGVPHCAAMCGAACSVVFRKGVPLSVLLGRAFGYAALGAVAAASAGLVSQWGREWAFVQPLWLLLQAAAFLMGVWLLWRGRMPSQVDAWGQSAYRWAQHRWGEAGAHAGRRRVAAPWVSLFAGALWVVLPCGLLYAAVMVAALAPHAWGGALVMLAFALPSAVGVWAAPALLKILARLSRREKTQAPTAPGAPGAPTWAGARAGGAAASLPVIWLVPAESPASTDPSPEAVPSASGSESAWFDPEWAVRLAGLTLALMAAWALYHQVLMQWQAWCA